MSTPINPIASTLISNETTKANPYQNKTHDAPLPAHPEASTQVTLSLEAQQQATRDRQYQAEKQDFKQGIFSPETRESLSQYSSANAYQYLRDIVYEETSGHPGVAGGLLDITDYLNGGPLRYSSGEPVTTESIAYFNRTDQEYRSNKIALFEAELSQGASPVEIFDKLFDLTQQQPDRLLKMKGYIS